MTGYLLTLILMNLQVNISDIFFSAFNKVIFHDIQIYVIVVNRLTFLTFFDVLFVFYNVSHHCFLL